MIVLTGAAGFIGSCVAAHLNALGKTDLILVDDFSHEDKKANYEGKQYLKLIDRSLFFSWIEGRQSELKRVIHLGARTDTTEKSWPIFEELNLEYSKKIWRLCEEFDIPLIYASSAATYGGGEKGFEDNEEEISLLKPLNPYGESKQQFDVWALEQHTAPGNWVGLKFFNVYGPNEYHKGRMASVVLHAFRQIQDRGGMRLFRSHRPDFEDGEQRRDFIYVKDVAKVIAFLMDSPVQSGIYNLGTGKARSFKDLTVSTFQAIGLPENISFIDTPSDIRDTYQYFTEADMRKLVEAGYNQPFYSLEEGITDYVQNYLLAQNYF